MRTENKKNPEGQPAQPKWQVVLEAGIRAALPTLADTEKNQKPMGEFQREAVNDLVRSFRLSWRVAQPCKSRGRSATQWIFRGHSSVMGAEVDFLGECDRDNRTGALLRFVVEYAGGPAGR